MSPKLLEKLKEIEAAAGNDWMTHFKEVEDVAGLRKVLLKWNIKMDDATADETVALLSSKVKEFSEEDLNNLANGGAINSFGAAIKYS